jgi:thiol-disulfide isomerase/thioredoxin/Ca2+-binding EF-hand superfamily protein/mono/diheme cytochrome c family protein
MTMRYALLLLVAALTAQAQNRPVLEQLGKQWLDDQFKKYDANADGKLSAAEAKPVAAYVSGADADHDGFITRDELQAHFRGQGGALQNVVRKALAAVSDTDIEQRFKEFDKNGDGKLVGEELSKARWLSRLSASADGVTLEQVKAFFATLNKAEPPASGKTAPPAYRPEKESPRQEPKRLTASEAGVGRMIADVAFNDLDGKPHKLTEFTGGKATIIAVVSPSCPVSKRYLPALAQFVEEAKGKGASMLLVAPLAAETPEQLRTALAEAKLAVPCAYDPQGTLSAALGAGVTTDVLVLDAKRTLVYRGALDDQYGLGYSLEAPRHRYASDALAAALTGVALEVQATDAPGCVLDLSKATVAGNSDVTYHNRISRILQANCVECHRSGGVAPFGLETIEQVNAKAGMMRKMVERQLMPPWFAAPTAKGEHSPWKNDRSLSERDRTDLVAWLSNGRPAGDSKDAPLARTWPTDWQIGTPDAVFQIPSPIAVKATGTMPYQNVVVQTGLTEDKWVSALEVQPTAREVVHHVLVFVRGGGGAVGGRRIAEGDEGGGFFAAYVPGNDHIILPEGFAKSLPAKATLVFQIHYTPNGTATQEQVKLGVRYSNKTPEHVIQVAGISNHRLSIPPGADNHPEAASLTVPREVTLVGFTPHMHVRGKAFRYELVLPGQEPRTLLDVPRYDFNWQLAYRYAEPITVPAGSEIRVTGWYDNSANNPANPDPAKTVHWGPQTTDEMMLGYVEYYVPGLVPKVAER